MVSQEQQLTFEQRIEAQRKCDIERALAAGDLKLAKVLETVEYEEVSPEERVEIDRALEAARNQTEWEEPNAFLKEWREEEPEFVAMLERTDERFPGWSKMCYRLPEDHPEDVEMLRRIEQDEPEAAAFIRSFHDDLRVA